MARTDAAQLRATGQPRGPFRAFSMERNFLGLISLPALLLMVGVTAIPFALTLGLAFTNYDPLRADAWGFVGLTNFARLFADENLPPILFTTFYMVAASVIIETVLGLGL